MPATEPDLKDILKSLREDIKIIKDSQKRLETEFSQSINQCHEKVDENRSLIDKQNIIIQKQQEIIDMISGENVNLKKNIELLQEEIDFVKQENRSKTLEIHGLPVQKNETLAAAVSNLAISIGFKNWNSEKVDECFQLPKTTSFEYPTIVLRLNKKQDKEEFKVRRDLNTSHIGMQKVSPIYVNESLTEIRRKLLGKARIFKKERKWKYVWIKNGKIFLRNTDNSKVYQICTQKQLNELMMSYPQLNG
ncbi:hypothetical protein RI129_005392 [Pyrocoelia pectoralis]|uniref:FP protein C-terminal domain-containing protein n=1 Tax=Pyrocoelia pectoralis TaxID=417401 RepID=A0AAN7ZSB0_9COLE